MGGLVKGDVVVIPFPFSDFSASKRRPAVVVAVPPGRDVIVAQITTNPSSPAPAVPVAPADFVSGQLMHLSYARPTIVLAVDPAIILYKVGSLTETKLQEINSVLIGFLSS